MKIKAYTHRETRDGYLPRDVLDALHSPQHVQVGELVIFAQTINHAWRRARALGLNISGPRNLRLATGNDVGALTAAGLDKDGAVYALPLAGHAGEGVVSIEDGDGNARYLTVVGHLEATARIGFYRFRPVVERDVRPPESWDPPTAYERGILTALGNDPTAALIEAFRAGYDCAPKPSTVVTDAMYGAAWETFRESGLRPALVPDALRAAIEAALKERA